MRKGVGGEIPVQELQLWQNLFLYLPAQLFPRHLHSPVGSGAARQMMPLIFLKSGVFIFEIFNNSFNTFSSRQYEKSSSPAATRMLQVSSATHPYKQTCPASVPNYCLVLAHVPQLSLPTTPHPSWSLPETGSINHKPKVCVHTQIACKGADCFLMLFACF